MQNDIDMLNKLAVSDIVKSTKEYRGIADRTVSVGDNFDTKHTTSL
jgi:hypothetical protein